jgi:hypothetical protein
VKEQVEKVTCPWCKGEGKQRHSVYHNDYVVETCDACLGSGDLPRFHRRLIEYKRKWSYTVSVLEELKKL